MLLPIKTLNGNTMASNINFSELNEDTEFKTNTTELQKRINSLGDNLKLCCESDLYSKLTTEQRVKYDLFLSYSLSSLYWIYLRTQGHDPSTHNIKFELDRIKDSMTKSKQIHDRRTIMPRIDQNVAKRFIRSGLWDPKDKIEEGSAPKKPKHTKFS